MNIVPAALLRNHIKSVLLLAGASTLFCLIGLLFAINSYAAIPSDAALKAQAAETSECQQAGAINFAGEGDNKSACVNAYVAGYKNPKGSADAYCKDHGAYRGACVTGFKTGQKDRIEADKDDASPPPKGQLSDAAIKRLAENSTTCRSLKSFDITLNANFDSCVKGYVSGYKNSPNTAEKACGSDSLPATCKSGYAAGKRDKTGQVTTLGQQTSVSAQASSSKTNEDACDATANPLTWIVCPIVDGTNKAVDGMENVINSLLTVDTNKIFDTSDPNSSGHAYFQAWSNFRTLALGIVFIAALIIIIASAFGYEILDAYTIRKTLPRVLIAIVFITLSWSILKFLIILTNDVGNGMRALIYSPFTGMEAWKLSGGAISLSSLIFGAGVLSLGIMGILSFGLTALVAVLIAFLVLVVRELLIVFLVLMAPIGIACLILPNTRKVWELWQKSLITMLVVFPIIAGMIAVGRVFAITTYGNGNASALEEIIAFIAYVAPYFLLFFAFKLAGGLMGAMANLASNRTGGMMKGLSAYRGNKLQGNFAAMKAGNRFKSSNALARGFNKTTRGIANVPNAGLTPWKMRSRYQSGLSTNKMAMAAEYAEKSVAFKAMSGNDDYLQATMKNMGGGDTEDDWRRYLSSQGYQGRSLEQGVAAIRAARRDTNDEVFKMATTVANASTGTGWKEGGAGQMLESINEATGDDRDSAARMLAEMRQRANQSGRVDLGGSGFGGQIADMNAMHFADENGKKMGVQEATERSMTRALDVKGPGAFAQARGQAVRLMAPQMLKNLEKSHARVTEVNSNPNASAEEKRAAERRLAQDYAAIASIHDITSQSAPENARFWADNVLGAELPGGVTVQDNINRFRATGNTDFAQSRRDFNMREKEAQDIAGAVAQSEQPGPTNPSG